MSQWMKFSGVIVAAFCAFASSVSRAESCPDLSGRYRIQNVSEDCQVGDNELTALPMPGWTYLLASVQDGTELEIRQSGCHRVELKWSKTSDNPGVANIDVFYPVSGKYRLPFQRKMSSYWEKDKEVTASYRWGSQSLSWEAYATNGLVDQSGASLMRLLNQWSIQLLSADTLRVERTFGFDMLTVGLIDPVFQDRNTGKCILTRVRD